MPRSDRYPASTQPPNPASTGGRGDLGEGHSLSPARWNRGAWLFRDRTLLALEILLDEAFVIPGTGIRFGLDGIIGLVPGLGDVLAGLLSLVIPLAGWIRGVPYVTLARMAANLGIGVLVGSVPLFGDIFDIAWKVNRRNYRLLCRHLGEPRRHTGRDWRFLLLLTAALALVFAIPLALAVWLALWLGHALAHASWMPR
ncbi:MAG: DUF4112 domain-containing protein [Terracidiphilus sp.]